MYTGLPKTSWHDNAIHNHSNMQKIGCSISMISVLYYDDLSSFRELSLFSRSLYFLLLTGRVPPAAYWISYILPDASTRQLCPRMQSWVGNTCIAKLLLGVYRNLLEHANFPIFSHWCQQRKHRRVCALAKTRLSLRCIKMRQIPIFQIFSLLMRAAKVQASLYIGICSTEPSLLENAITVHCEIFQIKHRNINKRVIRTYFL